MSTSAESATLWLQEKKPSSDTIEQMIVKLNERIERSGWSDEELQGSIEALDVLEAELQSRAPGASAPSSPVDQPTNHAVELDTSPLVSHDHIASERPPEEKRALFEQLKQQIKA
ncbi:hypothetical protein NFC81_04460 [Salinispirillum sp. LH 10-3-1]|uniref:Transcriptional regulator n=1 Tax=Salinispirillum sp. LH 10-3-1 TaxID=2952525 RepID=A0AB38YIE0_9GAMM